MAGTMNSCYCSYQWLDTQTNEYLTAESTAITAVENGNIVNSLNYKQLFDEVFVIHCIWNNQG